MSLLKIDEACGREYNVNVCVCEEDSCAANFRVSNFAPAEFHLI